MAQFCVNTNAQNTGEHEVHNLAAGCSYLPLPGKRIGLGSHATCREAMVAARRQYNNVDGCAYCASDCHSK